MRVYKKNTKINITVIQETDNQSTSSCKDQPNQKQLADETKRSTSLQNNNDCRRNTNSLSDSKSQSLNKGNINIDEQAISEVASILQAMGDFMELSMILKRNLNMDYNISRFGRNTPQ